jgi:hypothetical protein
MVPVGEGSKYPLFNLNVKGKTMSGSYKDFECGYKGEMSLQNMMTQLVQPLADFPKGNPVIPAREKLIYLASPYSSPDAELRQLRFELAVEAVALGMRDGIYIYSPIVNCHNVAEMFPDFISGEWKFWERFDHLMISKCDELWVLTIDGWEASKGVRQEVEFACNGCIPVKFYSIRYPTLHREDYSVGNYLRGA